MTDESMSAAKLGRLLREQRVRHGWKLEALGRKAGLDHSYLSRLERAVSGTVPPVETLEKLAYAYELSLEDLQAATGPTRALPPVVPRTVEELLEHARMVAPIAIPVIEHPAHAGHSGSPIIDYVYMDRPSAVNRNLVCIPVKGDCMAPRILEGDRVIVDRDLWPEQGDVVVAVVDEQVYVRRFYQRNGNLVLKADKPDVPDLVAREGDIIGKVVQGTYSP